MASYAVIASGGRQVRVTKGDHVRVDRLDVEVGKKVTFDQILLVDTGKTTKVGTPTVSGASVTGRVIEQSRDRKVLVFKKKRRKQYRRLNGHRQHYTLVEIDGVKSK